MYRLRALARLPSSSDCRVLTRMVKQQQRRIRDKTSRTTPVSVSPIPGSLDVAQVSRLTFLTLLE